MARSLKSLRNEIMNLLDRYIEKDSESADKLYILERDDGEIFVEQSLDGYAGIDKYDATNILASEYFDRLPLVARLEVLSKAITKSDVCQWVEEKRIPEDVYEQIAKELEPLPKILYVNYDEGIAWAQMHIRGLDPDDTKKYQQGKLSFRKLIEGHSIHVDLRIKFKNAFVQWVITQDHIPDYFDTIIGRRDPKTGNASKGLAIVKPSAEEPEKTVKAEPKELIIGPDDAKLIEKYVLFDKSYIIPAGDVGATPYKDAYMCAIWLGKAKAGVQRPDLHEYFLYPNPDLPERNKELFNGRFIIRCFKAGSAKRWWVWKAYDDPYPMDSIMHCDIGHYWPIPAEELEKFGREAYREESQTAFRKKLGCPSAKSEADYERC